MLHSEIDESLGGSQAFVLSNKDVDVAFILFIDNWAAVENEFKLLVLLLMLNLMKINSFQRLLNSILHLMHLKMLNLTIL